MQSTEVLKGKKLLILGGVEQMTEVVETAHKMGVTVYVTDYLADSPCKKYADKSFMINALDVDAVVDLCKKEEIDGVLTGYVDLLLPYYAEICSKANLPCYGTKEQFEIITNKKRFKQLCIEHHVPVAHEYTNQEIASGNISFPVIVKPADGSGSKGITICNNAEELNAAVDNSLSASRHKEYVIEEFLPDGKALMQYYVQDGEPFLVGLADQYMVKAYDDKLSIASCLLYPSKHLNRFMEQEDSLIRNMFRDIGIRNGCIELETYPKDGKLYLGDIGFRLCGSRVQYLYRDAYGVFSPEMLVRFALTGKMADYDISARINPTMMGHYYGKINIAIRPGKIHQVTGLEQLEAYSPVFHVALLMKAGQELKEEERGKLKQIAARIFFKTDTLADYETAAKTIFNTLDFIDEDGQTLKLPTDYYHECIVRYQSDMTNMITGGYEH